MVRWIWLCLSLLAGLVVGNGVYGCVSAKYAGHVETRQAEVEPGEVVAVEFEAGCEVSARVIVPEVAGLTSD